MKTSILESFAADQISNTATVTGGKGGNGRAHPPTSQDIGQNGNPESVTNQNNRHSPNNTNRPGNEGR